MVAWVVPMISMTAQAARLVLTTFSLAVAAAQVGVELLGLTEVLVPLPGSAAAEVPVWLVPRMVLRQEIRATL